MIAVLKIGMLRFARAQIKPLLLHLAFFLIYAAAFQPATAASGVHELYPSDLCIVPKKNKLLFTLWWSLASTGKCLEVTEIKQAENWPPLVVDTPKPAMSVYSRWSLKCCCVKGTNVSPVWSFLTSKCHFFDGTAKLPRTGLCHRMHFSITLKVAVVLCDLCLVSSKPEAIWLRNLVCLPVILAGTDVHQHVG